MAARRTHSRTTSARPWRQITAGVLCLLAAFSWFLSTTQPATIAADAPVERPPAVGYLVNVPLPISSNVNEQVQKMIDQVVEAAPKDGARPTLILEFRAKTGQSGDGSEFESSNALARYLVNDKLRHMQTVAYIPEAVRGHAVLPVLACEKIVMSPHATLGEVVANNAIVDEGMLASYLHIAKVRRTIALPLVQAMLDKNLTVSRVTKGDQTVFVLGEELERLKQEGAVDKVTTVVGPDKPAVFRGEQLRELGFVTHLVKERNEVATALNLPASALETDPSLQRGWHPVLVRLEGPIRTDKVNFIIRTLEQRLARGDVNFICVEIDSAGGSLVDSLRLAEFLSQRQEKNIRTVAYVPYHARGDAALVAIACDHLIVQNQSVLGGPGEINLDPRDREDLAQTVKQLVQSRPRGWSLPLSLVDRDLEVFHFVHDGDNRSAYYCDAELAEQAQPETWKKGGKLETRDGLSGEKAEEVGLARFVVANFGELQTIYHLEIEPERLQANWAHLLIEHLARPEIAGFLLFIAFFTLSIELMTPGVGLPGFISAVCFLLFFWANVLQGTAGALEIILFVGGIAFIAIEMFALPGLGAFGIGGVLMIIASVILASQTFVIPRNAYQFEQLPRGIIMATIACAGVIVSLAVFRKYLHKAPVINRMLLQPPEGEELSRRESLASYNHLVHKRGTTITPLTPAGKARFGDDLVDVVSDGDFLLPGTSVYVVEASGNRVVVKGIDNA